MADAAADAALKEFKGQPWILFDSVVSSSFLVGDTVPAVGGTTPAVNSDGSIVFFNSPGRSKSNTPYYTNMDQPGTLSYGLEVWAMYLLFGFPTMTPNQNIGYDVTLNPGVPGTVKLTEAILNHGVLDVELGQENQTSFPCTRFGAGGGMYIASGSVATLASNGLPVNAHVMNMPEPIEMPRTQPINARIRLAPAAQAIIGTPAAPGVGQPLSPYLYGISGGEVPVVASKPQLPFMLQFGFIGRRIKFTQYGQVPG